MKSTKRRKRIMNEEIELYPIFGLNVHGLLFKIHAIKSTADYNHSQYNLHHYITDYEKNREWYDERGIGQKLFLISIPLHEQLHNQAIRNLADEEFEEKYKISRWELIFNKKHSKY